MYSFVYFSCRRDFYTLSKSIDSIKLVYPDSKIFIFEDPENGFSQEQILELKEKISYIQPHPLGFSPKNGNGKDTFKAQVEAYNFALSKSNSELIIKIDSDTLISKKLNEYIDKSFDLIGTEVVYLNESKYIYGNLYIMSYRFVQLLSQITNQDFDKLNNDAKSYYAENRVIFGLAHILNTKTKIYPHDKGFVFNVDFISNYRISKASKTNIINSFSLTKMNQYPSIHYWSSNELVKYHLEKKYLLFYYFLFKKILGVLLDILFVSV
ncbi:hypothetical protein [Photobacterium damselae]|uniref:hypothetical protein n=1 Tax=Photobacterium damselae TaxID=38293 RepID=UPI001F16FB4E|nr:hypothetical protein [Photobacterium damselae]UKA02549.1 hypothetical protein IHC89_04305 [Photobacterium damselae subsp. damselae]